MVNGNDEIDLHDSEKVLERAVSIARTPIESSTLEVWELIVFEIRFLREIIKVSFSPCLLCSRDVQVIIEIALRASTLRLAHIGVVSGSNFQMFFAVACPQNDVSFVSFNAMLSRMCLIKSSRL